METSLIISKLRANHEEFVSFVSSLSETDFIVSKNDKWTPGQQLDHLIRSVKPVKMAFSLPSFVPRMLFGKANRDSRTYDEIVSKYQARLAAGGKASGRFIPPTIAFSQRESLTDNLLRVVDSMCKTIEKTSDSKLDTLLLPHPILGKLTYREMLCFSIYHVEHHHQAVVKNLES
jgi:hypothetical protein